MKNLLIIFLLLVASTSIASAAKLVTSDPSIIGQKTLTITCTYPIAREDGSDLLINEISKVNFLVEKNGTGGFVPAGENASACRQVYDLTNVPDATYVYKVTAVDNDGRESLLSDDMLTLIVKRIPNPNAPNGMDGNLS